MNDPVFFGEADEQQNIVDYRHHVRPFADQETRKYWEGRNWTGSRRLRHFQTNIYSKGLLWPLCWRWASACKILWAGFKNTVNCKSLEQQRAFFDTELAPLFDKRFVKWITNRKMSLYGLGIPPAQYEALAGGGRMADVLHERLEKLACGFPLRENYFTWQAFGQKLCTRRFGAVATLSRSSQLCQTADFQNRSFCKSDLHC